MLKKFCFYVVVSVFLLQIPGLQAAEEGEDSKIERRLLSLTSPLYPAAELLGLLNIPANKLEDPLYFGGMDQLNVPSIKTMHSVDLENYHHEAERNFAIQPELMAPFTQMLARLKEMHQRHAPEKEFPADLNAYIDYKISSQSIIYADIYVLPLLYMMQWIDPTKRDEIDFFAENFKEIYNLNRNSSVCTAITILSFDFNQKPFWCSQTIVQKFKKALKKRLLPSTCAPIIDRHQLGLGFFIAASLQNIMPYRVTHHSKYVCGMHLSGFGLLLEDLYHGRDKNSRFKCIVKYADDVLVNLCSGGYQASELLPLALQLAEKFYNLQTETYLRLLEAIIQKDDKKSLMAMFFFFHDMPFVFEKSDMGRDNFKIIIGDIAARFKKVITAAMQEGADLETSPLTGETPRSDEELLRYFLQLFCTSEILPPNSETEKGKDIMDLQKSVCSYEITKKQRFIQINQVALRNGDYIRFSERPPRKMRKIKTLFQLICDAQDQARMLDMAGVAIEPLAADLTQLSAVAAREEAMAYLARVRDGAISVADHLESQIDNLLGTTVLTAYTQTYLQLQAEFKAGLEELTARPDLASQKCHMGYYGY